MSGDVIKSFLVGLGFSVDDSSLSKFNKSIEEASVKVLALGAAIEATAGAIGYGISDISKSFEEMGYEFHIIAPAINKALLLRRELLKAYSAAGINITKVIQSSVKLNYSLAKTGFAFKAIYDSVGSRFFGLLTKQSDLFREKLYKNMPLIQNILEHLVGFVFKAFEATTHLGLRLFEVLGKVYDFFVRLDEKTGHWSTIIIGLVAAWKLLSLTFLASPLGIIIALGLAILALYDDFKTFKEGGQSLINWGSDTVKMIIGLIEVIAGLAAAFYAVRLAMIAWEVAGTVLIAGIEGLISVLEALEGVSVVIAAVFGVVTAPIWLMVTAVAALIAGLSLLYFKWGAIKGFFSWLGGKTLDIFGNNNIVPNLENSPGGVPSVNPLGPSGQNSQTNQHVTQQNHTTIVGTPNAGVIGQVSDSHSKGIFDLVGNMSGAVQTGQTD